MHVRKIKKDGGSSSFSDREGSFLVTRHETTLSEFGWRSAVCQIGPSRSREIHGMSKREKERAASGRSCKRTNEETVRKHASEKAAIRTQTRISKREGTEGAHAMMINHRNEMI